MCYKHIRAYATIAAVFTIWAAIFCSDIFSGTLSRLIYETKSKYSHIKITDENGVRTLWFVRDNGEEVIESQVDIHAPHKLMIDYTRTMFASLLINNNNSNALLIGLGGGAMVNFMNHYYPSTHLDVVEIDPVIVSIAKKYFCLKPNAKTAIHVRDGYSYIFSSQKRYAVIFMDAFLKPSSATDITGVPIRMKTAEFYTALKKRLSNDGMVVFNINQHENFSEDIRDIKKAFTHTYVFRSPSSGNIIVIGSTSTHRFTRKELMTNGSRLDSQKPYGFSFSTIATFLEE
jgi:spermidine synthase